MEGEIGVVWGLLEIVLVEGMGDGILEEWGDVKLKVGFGVVLWG